jgi:ATP-dependent helicase/nuclease subunit B
MILAKNKSAEIDPEKIINDRVKSGRISSLLILVPTNRKSRSLKKDLIRLAGGKISGKINIETIGTFSQKIYQALNTAPFQFLSEAASAVLLKNCFSSAKLNYFNRYNSDVPTGTLSRIKNIISEYKRHGILPEHLLSEALKLNGSERLKAEDIALIYSIYNEECRKSNSGETGDIYAGILDKSENEFSSAFRDIYPETDLVIINGFDEFTSPEINIINRISHDGNNELYLVFDYYDKNPGLFSHLMECYGRFISKGFHIIKTPDKSPVDNFRDLICKNYFNNVSSINESYNLTEIVALNRDKEIELIVKEIKELLEQGTQPSRICVAFNLIQNYSSIIRDKFTVYNLPFNLTDRIPLSSSGPVTAILSLLETAENDFYYKNIFRTLSSRFINIKNCSVSEMITAASELKIISGAENWITALEEGIKISDKRKRNTYISALNSVNTLKELLSGFSEDMTVPEFRDKFFDIIETLNISQNILSFKADTEVFFKGLSAFYDSLSELFLLLVKEHDIKSKFPLSFYLENIRTAVENTRFNITEKPGYGIQVTNLNEIRGLSFDYLFIGGMMDGELPTRYTPEIFFSGSYVREEWKHQVEERYRFYQSLCAWEKGLYLSRSAQNDNKELACSNFLSELKKHCFIKEKTEKDYSAAIYNMEELQDYAGRNINDSEIVNNLPGFDPENTRKQLQSYFSRTDINSESEYNGFIAASLSEEKRNILKELKKKEYSVSRLEIYAKCPFKYFLEKVLYLNIPEEPTEDMESYEFGNLIHNILFNFYIELKKQNILLYNCAVTEFSKAEEIMFSTAQKIIEESASKSPLNFLEIEKLLGFNGNRKKSVLYNFLTAERENITGFIPYDFEVPFGSIKGEDDRMTEIAEFYSGDVKLTGKIDRIDINEEEGTLKVTDYKLSGKKPVADDIEQGLSLQLPLYLYAAKQIVEKNLGKEFTPAGAEIYSLAYQTKYFGRKPIVSGKKMTEDELKNEYCRIISLCRDKIELYTDRISEGVFHPSILEKRETKVCNYCSFFSVCRIYET